MDTEQNDILISAYLDGELSADERARVEQLLASSAEARQLVEELKAIRAGLQSLPKHRLEPEFAQQVLRRAEQEAKSAAVPSASKAAILPQHDPWKPSIFQSKRGVAWSLVAIAAAVIIMVATRHDEQADRQVARQAVNAPAREDETAGALTAENKVAQEENSVRLKRPQPSAAPAAGLAKSEPHAKALTDHSLDAAPQNGVAGNPVTQMRRSGAAARSSEGIESFGGAAPQTPGDTLSAAPAAPPASAADAGPVLVVQVGLKQPYAAGNEFEQVLANNRIALESDPNKTPDEADRKQDYFATNSAPADAVDVVYVETSPQQLTAVLKELTNSKSLLSMSTTLSPPLPSTDKDVAPASRARRSDALHSWVAQNLNNLPQTIDLIAKPSAGDGRLSSTGEVRMRVEKSRGGSGAAPSASARAAAPSPPGTAQLYPTIAPLGESAAPDTANPPPLARAVFILRKLDSAAQPNPTGLTEPAAKSAPAEPSAPAAEKQ